MNDIAEDGDRGVAPAVALYSILGFWFFYTVIVSLRAAVIGFDAQWELRSEEHTSELQSH